MHPVVIGIAGGSGSGKSTVLRRIVESFGPARIAMLDHDSYYRDLSHLSLEVRMGFNFDHPNALETELMVEHLDALLRGETVQKPTYDFVNHSRADPTIEIRPRPVVIVEGILVLAEAALVDRMDIKIFVDTDDDIRLVRRIRRDIEERGRAIHTVLDQYERTVRPMYLEFVEPSKRRADVIIPRGGHNRVGIEMLLARIHLLLDAAEKADADAAAGGAPRGGQIA